MMEILFKLHFMVIFLVSSIHAASPTSSINSLTLSRVTRANSQINNNLIDNIIPITYKIKLNPDFDNENLIIHGNLKINIIVKESTNVITLHASNIIIKLDGDLKCDYPINVTILTIEPDNDRTELIKIIISENLHVGSKCNLTLNYTSEDGSSGLSQSQYTDEYGEKQWILLSHNSACNVFPCFADQTLKVKFIISIVHSKQYIALSNMNPVKDEIDPQNSEQIITYFDESPEMYPFKVMFAIGDFIKADNYNKELTQVWAPRDFPVDLNYAQKASTELIKALDNYTDFPYETHGLKKLDIIIGQLPIEFDGFSFWGIITLNMPPSLLSFDNSSLNSQTISDIQMLIHELSHQWFGGLLALLTVESNWLFEGLAYYLQYLIADQFQPTWRIMDKFVTKNIQSEAFIFDSTPDIHNMENVNLNSNADVEILYKKSGSIIRMISYILGEEKFKIALRNFIKTKAFKSVTSDDFFKELTNVYTGNINISEILKNWVTIPGYPIISVKRDYDAENAIITQSRFLNLFNSRSIEKYWIPINFVTEENLNFMDTNVTHWFEPSMNSIEINQLKKDQFVIFNKQLFGYYRVEYDNENWKLIINYLKNKNYSNIHVLNRAQLIDDAFNLVEINQLDYRVVLSLLEYLKRETDFIPWSVAWKVIKEIYDIVINTEVDKYFKKYILDISEKLKKEVLSVQLDETDLIMEEKKNEALKWICLFGSSSCRSEATTKVINWLNNPETNALSANEKDWIICAALQTGNQTIWNKVWIEYCFTDDPILLSALSCTSDVANLKEFLVYTTLNEATFIEFFLSLFQVMDNSVNGVTVVLDYIIQHHKDIITLDNYSSTDMQDIIFMLAHKIRDKFQQDKLKTFIEANKAILDDADQLLLLIDKSSRNNDKKLYVIKAFFKEYEINNHNNSV